MEVRHNKMTITSPGGNAGKNAEGFRINIPTVWARTMGITKNDRDVILSFENNKITIEKQH